MRVTLLCSDINHPVCPYLRFWQKKYEDIFSILIVSRVDQIKQSGDILFLISCSEIVEQNIREMFKYTLVLHASDLPDGRGWNPHVWDVISGKSSITLSLINAEDSVDTGHIWKKESIQLRGTELYDEINSLLFKAEIDLITWACKNIATAKSTPQIKRKSNYYKKRTPADSEVDINKSIKEQFNLLRVCDPDRFPAFFEIKGQRFKLTVEKYNEK